MKYFRPTPILVTGSGDFNNIIFGLCVAAAEISLISRHPLARDEKTLGNSVTYAKRGMKSYN
jgi:hypothetical protein